MFRRMAVLLVLVAGCSSPLGPSGSVSTGTNQSASTAFTLTTYDAGDFQIGVPNGWTQVVKDQPTQTLTNRCTFRLGDANSVADATLIVTTGNSAGAKLADQYQALKDASTQTGESPTSEYKNAAGELWGMKTLTVSNNIPFVNYRFIAVGPQTLYLMAVLTRQGGKFTDDQVLQIANSFKLKSN